MGIGPSLFRTSKRIHTGIGCLANLADEITRISPEKLLVIMDPVVKKVGPFDRLNAVLEKTALDFEVFEGIDKNPLWRP